LGDGPARAQRGANTRARILEVAEREFAATGYAGAHLQSIASQVGVQKTALYYYFESKAALYEAVLIGMLESFESCVLKVLDGPGSSDARMGRLLDDLNDLLAERRQHSRMLFRLFVDQAPIEWKHVGPIVERVVERVLRFYREGVDEGVFVQQSARHVFQTLLGGLIFHYASAGFGAAVISEPSLFSDEAIAWRREEARRLLLRGLLR
jgi:AcrR family transcriptional regulator